MKNQRERSIGVLDSGAGGLTVVRELERILPGENILYFGDSKNCPYGNRTESEILGLTFEMLDFMREQNVKIAAVACNTISTLIDRFKDRYDFPVLSIVEAACTHAASLELDETGVFATEFTIKQGVYGRLLRRISPETRVYSIPSRKLAALVDSGCFDTEETDAEILSLLIALRGASETVSHVIFGCTHYPIVAESFERVSSGITFINPAVAQAEAVRQLLKARGLLSEAAHGRLEIYTSGERQIYDTVLKKLDISLPFSVHSVSRSKP